VDDIGDDGFESIGRDLDQIRNDTMKFASKFFHHFLSAVHLDVIDADNIRSRIGEAQGHALTEAG
jgi:hypothetical protein